MFAVHRNFVFTFSSFSVKKQIRWEHKLLYADLEFDKKKKVVKQNKPPQEEDCIELVTGELHYVSPPTLSFYYLINYIRCDEQPWFIFKYVTFIFLPWYLQAL